MKRAKPVVTFYNQLISKPLNIKKVTNDTTK